MYDFSLGTDKEDRGAEPIEDIGKGGGFGLPEIDDFAGAHRTAHVRHDETHAPAHFVVDHTARFATNDGKIRAAARCFFEHRICRIDPALWLRPFAVKTASAKFFVRHQVRNAYDLFDFAVGQTRDRIELPIRLRIKLHEIGVDADLIMDIAEFADCVLRQKAGSLTSDI